MRLADYSHGILQLSASIRRFTGLSSFYEEDSDLLEWLRRGSYRSVAVILIDGMGKNVMDMFLDKNSFFMSHKLKDTDTVYPPTTAAATTAFLTGKSPKETGWLGWNQYFKEKDDQIILFRDMSQYEYGVNYPGFVKQALPVKMIYDELNENEECADSVWPSFSEHNPCDSYPSLLDKVKECLEKPNIRFVYGYWDMLDDHMHCHGATAASTGELLHEIEEQTQSALKGFPEDSAVIFIADHGHIDVRHFELTDNSILMECLDKAPALEGRTAAFYLKKGKEIIFEDEFKRVLGNDFVLMTHQQAVESNLFGLHEAHPRFEEFIGDRLAIAVNDIQLDYAGKGSQLKGNHAGATEAELRIPVIVWHK